MSIGVGEWFEETPQGQYERILWLCRTDVLIPNEQKLAHIQAIVENRSPKSGVEAAYRYREEKTAYTNAVLVTEMLSVLKGFPGYTDQAAIGDVWLERVDAVVALVESSLSRGKDSPK